MSADHDHSVDVCDTPEYALALTTFVAHLTSAGITKMACADMFANYTDELRLYLRSVAFCLRHAGVESARQHVVSLREPIIELLPGYAPSGLSGGQTPELFLIQFEISCCGAAPVTPSASARHPTAESVIA
jgi:hypothetical protein